MTGPTLLEQRYRRVLRLLPEAYRRAWERDMVTALLDTRGVDGSGSDDDVLAGLGAPGPGEVASVVWLAVRARVGVLGATPRQEMWGQAVRRVALVGLLVNSAFVLADVFVDVLLRGVAPFGLAFMTSGLLGEEPAQVLRIGSVLWPMAFAALLLDRRSSAGVLALGALMVETAQVIVVLSDFAEQAPFAVTLLVGRAVPVLALVAVHHGAPRPRRRPWLIAVAVATALVVTAIAPFYLSRPDGPGLSLQRWFELLLFDQVGLWALALTAAAAVHVRSRHQGQVFGQPGWTLALTLLAAVVTTARVLTLVAYLRLPDDPIVRDLVRAGLVQSLLAASALVVLALLARSDLPASASVSPARWPRTRPPTPQ